MRSKIKLICRYYDKVQRIAYFCLVITKKTLMLNNIIDSNKVAQFQEFLNTYSTFAIVGHIGPDGDAVGSSLGLAHLLDQLGKKVTIITPNAFPEFLQWLPGSEKIIFFDENLETATKLLTEAEVVCMLDFNTQSRVGDLMEPVLRNVSGKKVMIDHHLHPEACCDITMSYPKTPATSVLVFHLIEALGYYPNMTKEQAECLYTGMMTDTGSFTYNSNDKDLYQIISLLLDKGIDKDAIYRKVNNTYSENRLRLMGYVLTNMKVYPQNAALLTLTDAEQEKYNFVKGDSEGFVNIPLSIKNVIFSCFLKEDKELNMIKISLRSVGAFPCNEVAKEFFNGGGHLNASGGEFFGTMEDAIARFEQALIKYEPLLVR